MSATDAEHFRKELVRTGLTQSACARLLDVHDRTVRRWHAGDALLPYVVRLALAAIPDAT